MSLGESWILHATVERGDDLWLDAIDSLKARGEWPPTPEGRTAMDIAAEVDAMRRMTPEQRRTVPYEVHGNHYLRGIQLIMKELGW